jgi:DNA-binding transcriptional MerR regulator
MTVRGWSTRQLADLAGTTVKAVRHYHAVGLLDEPPRLTNGYKQYQVSHLLRLLRIRRLTDLGVPLSEVGPAMSADRDPEKALRVLDGELEATVARLQAVRAELALLLRHGSPTDVPEGFGGVADRMSESSRAMLMIYSRVFDERTMDAMRRSSEETSDWGTDAELAELPDDADESTRQSLAVRIVAETRQERERYPELAELQTVSPADDARAGAAIVPALHELYSPTQLDVLRRVHDLLQQDEEAGATADAAG